MRTREESHALAEEQQLYAGLKGDLFRVDRLYKDSYDRDEILRGVTREQAMQHCQDPETSSLTCTSTEGKARTKAKGEWFDSWTIDMEATYKAAKMLTMRAVWMMSQGQPNSLEASMSKAKTGLAVTKITQKAVELMGPLGYSKKYIVEKCMRDAKINDIFEGTGQINMLVVARRVLEFSRDQLK